MKKLLLGLGIIFLCSCSEQEYFEAIKMPENYNSYSQEAHLIYGNDKAKFDISFTSSFDAKGTEIKNYVPGDVFDLFYLDNVNQIDHIFIHKAYILEIERVNDSYYSSFLKQNIDISSVEYCILDQEYHYKINTNLEYTKIYVSISEDDFINKRYIAKSIYTFNPRKDKTLLIKNVTYDYASSPNYCGNEFENNEEAYSKVRLYYNDTSMSHTHIIKRVELDDNQLYIFVDDNHPLIGDCAMAYRIIDIEIEKIVKDNIVINIKGY